MTTKKFMNPIKTKRKANPCIGPLGTFSNTQTFICRDFPFPNDIYTNSHVRIYTYTYVCVYRLGLRTRVVEKKGKACGVWTTFLTTLCYGVYERDGGRLNLFMLSHLNDRVVVVE